MLPVGEVDPEIAELLFQTSLVLADETGLGGDVLLVWLTLLHDQSGVEGQDEWYQPDAEEQPPDPLQVIDVGDD